MLLTVKSPVTPTSASPPNYVYDPTYEDDDDEDISDISNEHDPTWRQDPRYLEWVKYARQDLNKTASSLNTSQSPSSNPASPTNYSTDYSYEYNEYNEEEYTPNNSPYRGIHNNTPGNYGNSTTTTYLDDSFTIHGDDDETKGNTAQPPPHRDIPQRAAHASAMRAATTAATTANTFSNIPKPGNGKGDALELAAVHAALTASALEIKNLRATIASNPRHTPGESPLTQHNAQPPHGTSHTARDNTTPRHTRQHANEPNDAPQKGTRRRTGLARVTTPTASQPTTAHESPPAHAHIANPTKPTHVDFSTIMGHDTHKTVDITNEHGVDAVRNRKSPSPIRALSRTLLSMMSPTLLLCILAFIFAWLAIPASAHHTESTYTSRHPMAIAAPSTSCHPPLHASDNSADLHAVPACLNCTPPPNGGVSHHSRTGIPTEHTFLKCLLAREHPPVDKPHWALPECNRKSPTTNAQPPRACTTQETPRPHTNPSPEVHGKDPQGEIGKEGEIGGAKSLSANRENTVESPMPHLPIQQHHQSPPTPLPADARLTPDICRTITSRTVKKGTEMDQIRYPQRASQAAPPACTDTNTKHYANATLSPACIQRTKLNTPTRVTKQWSSTTPSSPRCNMQSDSGASVTIINDRAFFVHGLHTVPPIRISTATGAHITLNQGGTAVLVTIDVHGTPVIIERHTAYYAPTFPVSLIAEGDLKNDTDCVITKTASHLNADRLIRRDRHNNEQCIPFHDDANCSWLEIIHPTSTDAVATMKSFYSRTTNLKAWNDLLHSRSSGICRPASTDDTTTNTSTGQDQATTTHKKTPAYPQWTPHNARLHSATNDLEAHRLGIHYRRRLIHQNTPARSRTLAEAHAINHFGDTNNTALPGQSIGLNITTRSRKQCPTCQQAKPKRGTVPQTSTRPIEVVPSRRIAIDHCGPYKTGIGGYKYILRATCTATKLVVSAPARTCGADETIAIMEHFLNRFRRHGHIVEEIVSDGHQTFRSNDWEKWCAVHKIDFEHTPPYAHNQNPVERAHRDLSSDIRATLNASNFPLTCWPLFVQGCDHHRNTECIRTATGMTAHEAQTGLMPNIYHHAPLGSAAIYIHPRDRQHNAAQSFDIRGFNTYVIGYRPGGYLLFCATSGQTIEASYCDTTIEYLWQPRQATPPDLAKYEYMDPNRTTLRNILRPVGHSIIRVEALDTIKLTPAELRAKTHCAHRQANNNKLTGASREQAIKKTLGPKTTTPKHHQPAQTTNDEATATQLANTRVPGQCTRGHPMNWLTPDADDNNGICDTCHGRIETYTAAHCQKCGYDRCHNCSPRLCDQPGGNRTPFPDPPPPPALPQTTTITEPSNRTTPSEPPPPTTTLETPPPPTPEKAPPTPPNAHPTDSKLGLVFNDHNQRRSTRTTNAGWRTPAFTSSNSATTTETSASATTTETNDPIFPTCSAAGHPIQETADAPPSRFAHRSSPLTCISKDSIAMPSKTKSDRLLHNATDTIRILHDQQAKFEKWATTVDSNTIAAYINSSLLRDPDYPSQGWALNQANPERESWLQATLAEIKTLVDAGAIEAIPLSSIPAGTNIMRSLFVYRRKRDAEGNPIKDKARLVCDGSSSTSDDPTFSPTCQLSTVKLLSAFAVHHSTLQHQTDISAAYVQAPMHRNDVYMRLPRNLDLMRDENGNQLALHIHKSLYGHPVSGKNWWDLISGWATKHGYTFSKGDPCLWTKRVGTKWIALSIYVDDMSACSNDPAFLISDFIKPLTDSFPARYEGAATWTLGTAIKQAASPTIDNLESLSTTDDSLKTDHLNPIAGKTFTTNLSNKQKLVDILLLTGYNKANPAPTPMIEGIGKLLTADNHAKSKNASKPPTPPTAQDIIDINILEDQFKYAHTVSALAFIARATRPDFIFAANLLARFMGNPQRTHYDALKRLLRYIAGTLDYGITYHKDGDDTVKHFCDAAHQDDTDTRHSTLGYVSTWKGAAIAYHSRKSARASSSSAESELYGLNSASKSVLALAKDLRHLNITAPLQSSPGTDDDSSLPAPTTPQTIYVDNQATCTNVTNRYQYSRLRHIDASFMMVHERVHEGHIKLKHIAGSENPADLFTKALPRAAFERHRFTVMGM